MNVSRAAFIALALCAGVGHAQVELVDPDAPAKPTRAEPEQPPSLDDPESLPEEVPEETEAEEQPHTTPKREARVEAKDAGVAAAPKEVKPARPTGPTYTVRRLSDADLEQAWQRWRQVESGTDFKAEQAARAELIAMKKLVGATDMDSWAMGLLRVSGAHAERGDSGAAVEIAVSAPELAPSLPSAWVGLARTYFQADPSAIGRVAEALWRAVVLEAEDPRFSRPVFADVCATLLLALVLTAVALIVVLFIRRAYFFFYDFHFFFPRVASRWQTAALALVLLAVPIVIRLGVAPTLLAFFAALTMYVSVRERLVAAVLIALLGLVPTWAGLVVDHAAFAGTPADDLFSIERGGTGVEPLVQKYEGLAAEDKVGFGELFVLGHHHLRRGRLDQAAAHFRRALAINPRHAGTNVNMAVLFFLQGDLENSRAVLEGVLKTDPTSAIALFNLGRVHERRMRVYGDSAAGEVDKALKAFSDAAQLDPSLPRVSFDEKPPSEIIANGLVRTASLERDLLADYATAGDAGDRVRSQLTFMLLGDVPSGLAPFLPGLLAALLVGLGFLGPTLRVARECNRCGKAVSPRGDPDVSPGSLMCTQCVNVFARKNVVAPSLKVRKQLEVARYQSRIERTGLVLAALWSGLGHVFAGFPVRGAVYAFLFITAVAGAFLRLGLLRGPYDAIPSVLKLIPLVLVAILIYLTTFLALRRRQG